MPAKLTLLALALLSVSVLFLTVGARGTGGTC